LTKVLGFLIIEGEFLGCGSLTFLAVVYVFQLASLSEKIVGFVFPFFLINFWHPSMDWELYLAMQFPFNKDQILSCRLISEKSKMKKEN